MAATELLKHAECVHQNLHFLKIPTDSVQNNAEHCGINDDTDDEHSVYV